MLAITIGYHFDANNDVACHAMRFKVNPLPWDLEMGANRRCAMTMLVATPQATTTHSNTATSNVDVSRATWPVRVRRPMPAVTKLNTDAQPTITHWYDDPNALRGL